MFCDEAGCFNDASRVVRDEYDNDRVKCEHCFSERRKKLKEKKITVEFCMWLQDTEVFDTFVNHLNKGLKVERINLNKPLTKKAKGGV